MAGLWFTLLKHGQTLSSKSTSIEDDKLSILRLSLVKGLGPIIFRRLIDSFGDAERVLLAAPSELRKISGVGVELIKQITDEGTEREATELLEDCGANGIQIISCEQDVYPRLLNEITDPPIVLFQKGQLMPSDSIAIAVVGSRHATHYGTSQAESLGRALALSGFTVVSGLARGIDAAAHLGALKAGGRTLAVLGSGLLNIYPSEHQKLAKQIGEQGALLSEYPPRRKPRSSAFPRRNRIVTGLCLGTIVVEAAKRSGALISARLAMEQNREVFAVPGPVNSRMSRGSHQLIKDGAKLVESIDDVLEELGPLASPTQLADDQSVHHPAELKLSEQESKILHAIELEPTQIDSIIVKCGLPTQRVLSTISVLEIRRLVKRVSGTTVVRVW